VLPVDCGLMAGNVIMARELTCDAPHLFPLPQVSSGRRRSSSKREIVSSARSPPERDRGRARQRAECIAGAASGAALAFQYAENVRRSTRDSSYLENAAEGLLGVDPPGLVDIMIA
jgi:hypothetical protein